MDLYATSAQLGGGGFSISPEPEAGAIGDWASVDRSTATVPSGGSVTVTATLNIPEDAPAGEHYGAVVAELPAETPEGGGVATASRVGIRIYLSVGEGGEPASDFEIEQFTARRLANGRPAMSATVRNTGGRALDIDGELELADGPGGLSAGPFPVTVGATLGIGARAPVQIELDEQLPDGPWKATLRLRSGELERIAEATITFPREAGASARPVRAREVTGTIPGIIATGVSVFLLLLLAGWLFWYLLKKRPRMKREKREAS